MSSLVEQQPDAWQQHAIFTQLLQAPAAKQALDDLEKQLKPIFNSYAFYSLDTGMLTIKLQTLTTLLTNANLLPRLTPHNFKLGLHLAITPTLSQSASPSKNQPLHFDAFINAVAFCAYYYPPEEDYLTTPNPRPPRCPERLEVALTVFRERLPTTTESSRTILTNFVSPQTTAAFVTPRTAFSESSPTQTTIGERAQSPGVEQWFTPAQFAIRTKLFQDQQSNTPSTHQQDSANSTNPNPVSYYGIREAGDVTGSTPQMPQKEQDSISLTLSCARAEKIWHASETEKTIVQNEGISSPPTTQLNIKEEETLQQEVYTDSQLEESESAGGWDTSRGATTPLAAIDSSPLDHETEATALGDDKREELQRTPTKTPEASKSDSPSTPSTNLSLAPSTALSQLPLPDSGFESPELADDPFIPYNISSIGPLSSRRISFLDRDDGSDSSSCYENAGDNEETIMRIEKVFDSSHAVEDCDENDASSNLLQPHSQPPSSNGEDETGIAQTSVLGEETSAYDLADAGTKSSTEAEIDSELEKDSHTQAHNCLDSQSVSSDRDAFDCEAALASDKLGGIIEKEESVTSEATHDVALNDPKITLGLPAEAFSGAGAVTVQTPIATGASATFPDTDMEDMDEEEHTLLFENGYESDGSDLSMRTRETMSKMVEDYLSLHGSASPQYGLGKRCYAEDEALMTPDSKSQMEFEDVVEVENKPIVEDDSCYSEKAVSKQSRISHMVECSNQDLGKGGDVDNSGFKVETDAAASEKDENAFSPLSFSQKVSFSSEITPDGLNLIKKQLVLPSPFMFTDSTVSSSMSSGASGASGESVDKKDNVNPSEEAEKEEHKAVVTVAVKKENEIPETAVICQKHDASRDIREAEMMRVMRETLETCRVLREELARKQQASQERPQQQQYQGGFGRWTEFGIVGLIVIIATLVLVEHRIQRGVFLDVLV